MRFGEESAHQGDTGTLPTGKGGRVPITEALEIGVSQGGDNAFLSSTLIGKARRQAEGKVFRNTQMGKEQVVLEQYAHLPLLWRKHC